MTLATRTPDGYNVKTHAGQRAALASTRRFVFIVAGTQSGKTSFGPWWLAREIERCGEGDYLAVTATYDLFKLKMLPEMKTVFCEYLGWEYQASDRTLTKGDSRIILRSANAPGGLESATAKAAWLDECGQDEFTLDAWEAVQRRLSLSQGRVLGTTTPYNMGWLKQQVYDRWTRGDPDYQVVQFKSTMNPVFPLAEYERAKATLPPWKFSMFYDGEFSRPAGMIYDAFDAGLCKIPTFVIPDGWPRYGGLDFGGQHTAAMCYAEGPDGTLYAIKEYLEGGRSISEHAAELSRWGCRLWVGGSKSEGQWRQEFRTHGLPIMEPSFSDVEAGIDRVYSQHKKNGIMVFDTLSGYLDQKGTYSRELDASGQPTEAIKNKAAYHFLDAERYIIGKLRGGGSVSFVEQKKTRSTWDEIPTSDNDRRW
jgi:hypothetical protein